MGYNFEIFETYNSVATCPRVPVQRSGQRTSSRSTQAEKSARPAPSARKTRKQGSAVPKKPQVEKPAARRVSEPKPAVHEVRRVSSSKKSVWSQFSIKAIVLSLLAVFSVFAVMINGQMQLTELSDQISNTQVVLEESQDFYTTLKLDADTKFSSNTERIEEYAESHGMQKLGKHQLEGFEMTQGNKVEVFAAATQPKDVWSSITELFDNLLS